MNKQTKTPSDATRNANLDGVNPAGKQSVGTLKEQQALRARSRDQLSALLPQLARLLDEIVVAAVKLTVPERVAMIRSVMEVYGADGSLDEFVSWFELERDEELE